MKFIMKYKSYLIIALILILCFVYHLNYAPQITSVKTVAVDADPVMVMCFGDSNTWGTDPHDHSRYHKHIRWTGILQDKLGDGYEVVSEGLNGRTTAFDTSFTYGNGLQVLPSAIGSNKPIDYLIFMLGTNDCKIGQEENAADIAEGMEELVACAEDTCTKLQGYIPTIIIVSPPALRDEIVNSDNSDIFDAESVKKSHEIGPLYEKIAKKHNCIYVNGTDTLEVSEIDCVHMTELGHKELAEILYYTVKEN